MSAPSTWPAIVDAASAPYRIAGRFAWRFARGKLGHDPVFRHVLIQGLIAPRAPVLDIGCGQDMREAPFPPVDTIVMLDVLHYITVPEQDALLARVRAALPAGGVLLLRVGDATSKLRFRVSQWVDTVVTIVRGHRVTPQFGRPLSAWIAALHALGFHVNSEPMSQGTPFANVLMVARVRGGAAP